MDQAVAGLAVAGDDGGCLLASASVAIEGDSTEFDGMLEVDGEDVVNRSGSLPQDGLTDDTEFFELSLSSEPGVDTLGGDKFKVSDPHLELLASLMAEQNKKVSFLAEISSSATAGLIAFTMEMLAMEINFLDGL